MPARTPATSRWHLLAIAVVAAAGCRSLQRNPNQIVVNPAAATLSANPTLEEVASVINQNSQRVERLYAPQARIGSGGDLAPKMQSIIAFERPDRLRLQGTVIGRSAVDLGVNEELAWMGSPDAVMYVRRGDLRQGVAADVLPLQPAWVADLFGLPEFMPEDVHSEPIARGEGVYKITTHSPESASGLLRVTVFDANQGVVTRHYLYTAAGKRVAGAVFSDHRRDPVSGAVLPGRIAVSWPYAGQEFEIELGVVEVNAPPMQLAANLWRPPQESGAPMINLADRGQIERYMASQP